MKFSFYILYFIVFSIVGWIIDSAFRSVQEKKLVNSGYFRYVPVCPIYGFGGIILIGICTMFSVYGVFITCLVASSAMVILEYVGGVFCDKLLNQRVWDYSRNKWNLHGHISLQQSFYWVVLVIIFYYVFFPWILRIEETFHEISTSSSLLDIALSILFWVFLLVVTAMNRKKKRK